MKKMRKFAWIFMAAMTVAGFSACSNSEDEDLSLIHISEPTRH